MLIADLEAFEAEANGEQVESEPRLLIHVGPDDTLDTDYEAVIGNLQTLLSRFHGRVVTTRTHRFYISGSGFIGQVLS